MTAAIIEPVFTAPSAQQANRGQAVIPTAGGGDSMETLSNWAIFFKNLKQILVLVPDARSMVSSDPYKRGGLQDSPAIPDLAYLHRQDRNLKEVLITLTIITSRYSS